MEPQIKGTKTLLREVTVQDAAAICALRNDEKINKYLSTSRQVSIAEQENWIAANRAKKDGYYFKIIDATQDEFCGTASIYALEGEGGDFGRYICTKALQAIEAEYLALEFAFTQMGLKRVFCRTSLENKKVWKQHLNYGFVDVGEETLYAADKELSLKIQELTHENFLATDYSFIQKLIQKF
jgi:RimJ/RimL family protein N-acetyltransferase